LDLILVGHPSKIIAADLHISQRTVDNHRAAIRRKTGTKSLSALIHTAICGRCSGTTKCNDEHLGQLFPSAISREAPIAKLPMSCPSVTSNRSAYTTGPMPMEGPARESNSSASLLLDIEAMRLNMNEAQHRIKNMVAVIQSISHQTMRQSTSKSDFDERFCTRLSAFCRSLDLLIANQWCGVRINELVRSQLAPFGVLDGARISVNGLDLKLSPAAAHSIALALHELATNAVKYGSLSVLEGRVDLQWGVDFSTEIPNFRLTWKESCGPAVTSPTHHGFGRQMIQQLTAMALSGKTTHEFLTDGVEWTLEIPASNAIDQGTGIAGLVTPKPANNPDSGLEHYA
jgi:two-component sensor histidine kinase